jgi:hypothetical protein
MMAKWRMSDCLAFGSRVPERGLEAYRIAGVPPALV